MGFTNIPFVSSPPDMFFLFCFFYFVFLINVPDDNTKIA